MARPWVATVLAILVLIFILALAGVPSRFLPAATPLPSIAPISGSPGASPGRSP